MLRLEKENKELKKTLGQLKTSNVEVSDLVREKSELHNKVMEGKSTIHSLNEVREGPGGGVCVCVGGGGGCRGEGGGRCTGSIQRFTNIFSDHVSYRGPWSIYIDRASTATRSILARVSVACMHRPTHRHIGPL